MRIISGHQAVYLPWLGLFHKLSLCDVFVYMDTVQYLRNDWNNRNKIRTPQGWTWLTVPIDWRQSPGDALDQIVPRGHDEPGMKDFWQTAHWRTIENNYKNAPFFSDYAGDLRALYMDTVWNRLVDVCWAQFNLMARWFGLDDREIVRMSQVPFEGVKDDLVLDHCLKLGGGGVVFGKLGREYVGVDKFSQRGIKVYFQDYRHPEYRQRFRGFEPYMCALDLVFNHGPASRELLFADNVTRDELRAGAHWENA